jgi:predicted GNAT superfamily acetyltransferase
MVDSWDNDAREAAASAGVVIDGIVSGSDRESVASLMNEIWGPDVVLPLNMLRAMQFAGDGVLLARRNKIPVGFSVGVMGWADGLHFHSHQVGVVESERSTGVGFALKMAQRAACLVNEMRWTFDPLLYSNAVFNLNRIGARIYEFLPNVYGARNDQFNLGDVTDRVKVTWSLERDVGALSVTASSDAPRLIDVSERVIRSSQEVVVGSVLPIPPDYHALRASNKDLASMWRVAMSLALHDVLESGHSIAGIGEQGYVVGVRSETV